MLSLKYLWSLFHSLHHMYILLQNFYGYMNLFFAKKTSILANFCLIFRPRKLRQVAAELKLFYRGSLLFLTHGKSMWFAALCRKLLESIL